MRTDESGRTRPSRLQAMRQRHPDPDVLARLVWRPLLVLAVVGAVTAVLAAGPAGEQAARGPSAAVGTTPDPGAAAEHGGTAAGGNGTLGAGEHLAGVVATQDQAIRGTVSRNAFQAQLDATETPTQRAALLDRELTEIEIRTETLAERLDNTSTVNTAGVGAAVRALDSRHGAVDAAAATLTPSTRQRHNLTARLAAAGDRLATLRARTTEATRRIDGAGTETWARPITLADIEAAASRSLNATSTIDRVFGSERVDLRVRTANGSVLRVAVRTDGGAVEAIRRGRLDNPTVRIYTDYRVVRTVQRTDEPATALREARDEGRIIYDGDGLYHSARYGVVAIAEALG